MSGLLGTLSFMTPAALAALLLLPVIWWLLRFTPPRPETVRFPPFRLLLKLIPREELPDRTPWWLMLLRLAIAALVIIAVAHPAISPQALPAAGGGPLLIVVDDGWAAAAQWGKRQAKLSELTAQAQAAGAAVTITGTVPEERPGGLEPGTAEAARVRSAVLVPKALSPDRMALLARVNKVFAAAPAGRIVWLSDGIDHGSSRAFADGLAKIGRLEVALPGSEELPLALGLPKLDGGKLQVSGLRVQSAAAGSARVEARATDGRLLGEAELSFGAAKADATADFDLPVELRNEISRIDIAGQSHAAARYLLDDRWKRKTVALMAGGAAETAQPLLSPLYYVQRALEPAAEPSQPGDAAALKRSLDSGLSMLVLADVGVLPGDEEAAVRDFMTKGGVLLRFAGPRLAAAQDALVPVALRQGGRSLDSALSWETPQALQAFPAGSPFAGIAIDDAVRVNRQVLAEPDADLPERVWAALADGTPLVTARHEGKGLLVLFHVTANADWSNLPLSGLFADMLQRIIDLAPAAGALAPGSDASGDKAQAFAPQSILAGSGDLVDPPSDIRPIAATAIDKAKPSPETPAGLYRRGGQLRAINLAGTVPPLSAIGALPAAASVSDYAPQPTLALSPFLFAAALLLLLLDSLVALSMAGGLRKSRLKSGAALVLAVALLLHPLPARADAAEEFAQKAALETHLAYVLTGDAAIDQVSEDGLKGLGYTLADRTSVEPADPIGIDIERDDISFFPLLYWPVKPDAAEPSDAALAKLARYMKNGGTLFFDLREDGAGADALTGGTSPAAQALQRMLAKLDIPPLEPVPPEHVLTRSFYLMQSFPGRYDQGALWVEKSDAASSATADGISSIIIGSNDYASAWVISDMGEGSYATSSGSDRQRELAFRAGINIVMYALTGNYKADQVHVPALLERLGQ